MKRKILVTSTELADLVENIVNRIDGKKVKYKPVKQNLSESVSKGKNIIPLNENDLKNLVNRVIKKRNEGK